MTATRTQLKLRKMVDFAMDLAELSTCSRKHQGCVIFPHDFSSVWGIGYNGPPMGQNNASCTGAEGPAWDSCGCVHGEANAMAKLGDHRGAIMYTTTHPCRYCAGLIVNSKKIAVLLWDERYKDDLGVPILSAGGVMSVEATRLLLYDEQLFTSSWRQVVEACEGRR